MNDYPPLWRLDDETLRNLPQPHERHIAIPSADETPTPTICVMCGKEIRPYGGEVYQNEYCEPCYEIRRFRVADQQAIEAALKTHP